MNIGIYIISQSIKSLFRSQLFEYLGNRMISMAPNLTSLVGELIGARLIAQAGSLMNLAKNPG